MQLETLFGTLEGRRVSGIRCYCCDGDQAILRRRWCKDELQLFCDRCEVWSDRRITVADLEVWLERRQYKFPLYSFNEAADGVMERCQIIEAAHGGC
jgi:hypothetical protein